MEYNAENITKVTLEAINGKDLDAIAKEHDVPKELIVKWKKTIEGMTSKSLSRKRRIYVIGYFIVSIFLLCILSWRYYELTPTIVHFFFAGEAGFQLIWCIFFSFIGFSCFATRWVDEPSSPFPVYLSYYPLLLFSFSMAVFSVLHLSEAIGHKLFYPFSASLCILLSFQVDNVVGIVSALISKRH